MESENLNMPLNKVQMLILRAFARSKSEKEANEIQALLLDYYQKKVDSHAKKITLSDEQTEEILNSHNRTPYK
jgi:Cu/Ag efflux protein CusF